MIYDGTNNKMKDVLRRRGVYHKKGWLLSRSLIVFINLNAFKRGGGFLSIYRRIDDFG